MNQPGIDMKRLFMAPGLSDEQEGILRKLVSNTEQLSNELYDEGLELDQELVALYDILLNLKKLHYDRN